SGSAASGLGTAYAGGRGGGEQTLTAIWQQVLGIYRVGIHDNFFDLGGGPILSIQIVSLVNAQSYDVDFGGLVENPTIPQFAPRVVRKDSLPAGQPVSGEALLSPIQRWFFEADLAERHHWNHAFLIAAGRIDAKAARSALQVILDRHDALRMSYELRDGAWLQ